MLSPQALQRAPIAYRKGYYDGYAGTESALVGLHSIGYQARPPFAKGDYNQGYCAGQNDAKWDNAK